MENNLHNDAFRWQMPTSIQVIGSIFPVRFQFPSINILNVWPWKCKPMSRSRTLAVMPLDGEYLNLYKHMHVVPALISEILALHIFYLEYLVQERGIQYSSWCHSMANFIQSLKVYHPFLRYLAPFVPEMLTFQICDLENLDKGYEVEHSQWCHSIGNTSMYIIIIITWVFM